MSSDWRQSSKQFESTPYHYRYASLADLLKIAKGKESALIVVLDHITDVGNLGAVIRSAEVVGACGLVIPKRRAASVNEAVFRTSAGAVEHIMIAQEANIADTIRRLQDNQFWVGAATEHARQDIWSAPLEGRFALVMGSEDEGISRLVRQSCDFEFCLPVCGVTQSLNVAQAATAIMYEWLRRAQ
jgi:23S rRNA (guanosine2251-2'-O)-methyltransferase